MTLKNAQCKSCQLSFIWGKMRTAAWEIHPQTALRNCSKEVGGKDSIHVILVKGEYMQSSTFFFAESFCWETIVTMKDFSAFLAMMRYKNWAHRNSSWEYLTIWRPVLPVFPQNASFLLSILNSFMGVGGAVPATARDVTLVEVDGKHPWQVPICDRQY